MKDEITVLHRTGIENTRMPKFNPYQTGYGTWKSAKYPDRAKRKAMERKAVRDFFNNES